MKRTIIGLSIVLALAAIIAAISAVQANDEVKVTICHKPEGSNPHSITVAQSAVPAHQRHGDAIGACPGSPSK
jgi:hypothetical protein